MNIRQQPQSRTDGFTLIEVLITIFVTAVGLLTVAGLQAAARKTNYETTQRTAAIALAQDMIERMRANPDQFNAYVSPGAASSCGTSSANPCDGPSRAANDVADWNARLTGSEVTDSSGTATGGLVSPTGCITSRTVTTGTVITTIYRVSIAWRGTSSIKQITDTTDPQYDSCGVSSGLYDSDSRTGVARRFVFLDFV